MLFGNYWVEMIWFKYGGGDEVNVMNVIER